MSDLRVIPNLVMLDDLVRKLEPHNPYFILDTSVVIPSAFSLQDDMLFPSSLSADLVPEHKAYVSGLLNEFDCYFVPSQKNELFPSRKKSKHKPKEKVRKKGPDYGYKKPSRKIAKSEFKQNVIKFAQPGTYVERDAIDMTNAHYLRASNVLHRNRVGVLSDTDFDLGTLTLYLNLSNQRPAYLLTFDANLGKSTNFAWRYLVENKRARRLGRGVYSNPAPNLFRHARTLADSYSRVVPATALEY